MGIAALNNRLPYGDPSGFQPPLVVGVKELSGVPDLAGGRIPLTLGRKVIELIGKCMSSKSCLRASRTWAIVLLDLVVITGTFLLGVENKIYAEAYNPFEEYTRRLEDIAKEKEIPPENILKILLSLKPERETEARYGFKPLMYDKFFSILRANIGQRMLDADQRCWIYLVDFITTIQNLRRQLRMNKDLLDFFKTHEDTAFKFNLELRELKDLLRTKTKKVAQCVERPECFPQFSFWSSISEGDETFPFICDSCFCFTEVAGVHVQIEVAIHIDDRGWQLVVWLPEGGDFSKVCKWLENTKFYQFVFGTIKSIGFLRSTKIPISHSPRTKSARNSRSFWKQ